ncbi:serine/threonine-protein kinase [Streptomyces antimicrobicus]|uniref:non-specific serine/threonine protein kinase n=1 Tax=Streptomyces antimicrobicus TaxID=2883108 RepID=A0ABS8AZZ4_9ACTN|nr:serine/threonine-protein kinase [Streptomyces antimicrobicus]MCB5177917.1 serine/threonine protein kinase [Streptomyces antimicrobicus]
MRQGDRLVGRYRLNTVIGRGGMGEVWEAEDLSLRRPVAVKLLLDSSAGDEAVGRFRREAIITARLRHPGVTVVHDVGHDGGRFFLVMELLEGSDLGTVLRDHPEGLPLGDVLGIAAQAADVLAAAEGQGIVHRDIKPSNLFLLPDGRVKVCDFGIARFAEATAGLTVTGRPFGTPAYMAPEQWRGDHVDGRCDLYALGCVLYALLLGRPPFSGGYHELLRRHVEEVPEPLRSQRPDVPPDLELLVEALLEKQPARRPGTAREVAAEVVRLRDAHARGALRPGSTSTRSDRPHPPTVDRVLMEELLWGATRAGDAVTQSRAVSLAARIDPALALTLAEESETRALALLASDTAEGVLSCLHLTREWTELAPLRVASLLAHALRTLDSAGTELPVGDQLRAGLAGAMASVESARAEEIARGLPAIWADVAWMRLAEAAAHSVPERALAWADEIGVPGTRDLALSRVATTMAPAHMNAVLRALGQIGTPHTRIDALCGVAKALAAAGDPRGGRHFLATAREEFERYEAAGLAQRPIDHRTVQVRIAIADIDFSDAMDMISGGEQNSTRELARQLQDAEQAIATAPGATADGTTEPLDAPTARARASTIAATPDPRERAHRLLDLAADCLGRPLPEPVGRTLLNRPSRLIATP